MLRLPAQSGSGGMVIGSQVLRLTIVHENTAPIKEPLVKAEFRTTCSEEEVSIHMDQYETIPNGSEAIVELRMV